MKEGLIKDTYELIIKELQTVITISYIVTVGIGMLFNYHKYSEFGINIFDYSDIFDFLIAPFSDGAILLFALASVTIVFLFVQLDLTWEKKWPKSYSRLNFGGNKKSWYKTYRIIVFAVTFILYLFIASEYYGRYTKDKIMKRDNISIRLEDNEIRSGKLIGKTKDVIFILNNKSVYAIPISSSVKEVQIK